MDNLLQRTRNQTPPSKVITKILSRPQQRPASIDTNNHLESRENNNWKSRKKENIAQAIFIRTSERSRQNAKVKFSSSYNKSKNSWIHSNKKFLGGFKHSAIKENEICSENYQPVTQEAQPTGPVPGSFKSSSGSTGCARDGPNKKRSVSSRFPARRGARRASAPTHEPASPLERPGAPRRALAPPWLAAP